MPLTAQSAYSMESTSKSSMIFGAWSIERVPGTAAANFLSTGKVANESAKSGLRSISRLYTSWQHFFTSRASFFLFTMNSTKRAQASGCFAVVNMPMHLGSAKVQEAPPTLLSGTGRGKTS